MKIAQARQRLAAYFFVAAATIGCSQSSQGESTDLAQIRADSARAHPNGSVAQAEATTKAANAVYADIVVSSPESELESAAIWFLGYYSKYTYAWPEVCREAGYPMTLFPTRFSELHGPLMSRARVLVDVDRILVKARATSLPAVKIEAKQFATHIQGSVADVCASLEADYKSMATEFEFSRVSPVPYRTLMTKTGLD